jgi:hypothetical protein
MAGLAVFLLIGGSIGVTVGYGLYYRSDAYRRDVQGKLEAFFGLPVDLQTILPHSLTARELFGVSLWLPDRRARVFHGPHILWNNHDKGARLDVYDGDIVIGDPSWENQDYMHVLRASLQHDFKLLNVREVRLHRTRITWPRNGIRIIAQDTEGKMEFDDNGQGWAQLTCRTLNGTTSTEPISIAARIDPESEELLPEVTLGVPPLPLTSLGLESIVGSEVQRGWFAGRIVLNQTAANSRIKAGGQLEDVQLAEWTARLPRGAIPAELELSIDEAVFAGRKLESILFRGRVDRLDVDALLRQFDGPLLGGTAWLTVDRLSLADAVIQRLSLSGQWMDGSLSELVQFALGRGGVEGSLWIRINSLVVEGNRPVSGDISIVARPDGGELGQIDRDLLVACLKDQLGVALPESLLPEKLPYVHMGARIHIEDGKAWLLAGNGPAGPALITVRSLGSDIPLLPQLRASIPLDALLARLEEGLSRLETIWARPPNASQPARAP